MLRSAKGSGVLLPGRTLEGKELGECACKSTAAVWEYSLVLERVHHGSPRYVDYATVGSYSTALLIEDVSLLIRSQASSRIVESQI